MQPVTPADITLPSNHNHVAYPLTRICHTMLSGESDHCAHDQAIAMLAPAQHHTLAHRPLTLHTDEELLEKAAKDGSLDP